MNVAFRGRMGLRRFRYGKFKTVHILWYLVIIATVKWLKVIENEKKTYSMEIYIEWCFDVQRWQNWFWTYFQPNLWNFHIHNHLLWAHVKDINTLWCVFRYLIFFLVTVQMLTSQSYSLLFSASIVVINSLFNAIDSKGIAMRHEWIK